jgi:hypothetical protein
VLLVEADAHRANELSAAAKNHGWDTACALLGDNDGAEVVYHSTSNPSANGSVPTDELRAIWPNLRSTGTHTTMECRLDRLLDARDPSHSPAPNWIFIDCLPSLPILKGAGRYLDNLDVVWARVVLDPQTISVDGGSLRHLTDFLIARGFRMVEVIEGVHPALGEAFFLRD